MLIKLENITKILYGISNNESIDVTVKLTDYLKMYNIINIDTNINKLVKDPYENQLKKLFIYTDNDIKIINELNGCLSEKIFINNKIIILTSYIVNSIAINLQYLLQELGYLVSIVYTITEEDCLNSLNYLYIIIHHSNKYLHSFLPKNYILYQIEQSESFFDKEMINMLNNSIAIWDYSVKNKDLYLDIPFNKFYYNPFPVIYSNDVSVKNNIKYDVLFYGAENTRRCNILNNLAQKYNICIKYGFFGDQRDELIKQSKIVINLHYYKNSVLETARINEVLKFGKLVITEKSIEGDDYNENYYKNVVSYFDIIKDDLSNIQQLYDLIDFYLLESNYNKKINIIKNNLYSFYTRSKFHLHKNLLSLNMKPNTMIYDVNVNTIYCLHLIETPYRLEKFEFKSNIEIYPAVKANPGFKGCGLSYQNLLLNAKRCGIDNITICEDDCSFNTDFKEKYNTIKSFLKQYTSGWDIFNGCISNLPYDTTISNVVNYNGLTFVEINKMHSTVFNIYNKTCYDKIITCNQVGRYNEFGQYNQIDQKIKQLNFKIITTYPFEFKCTDVTSTFSGEKCFDIYNQMFNNSLTVLKNKIDIYNSQKI